MSLERRDFLILWRSEVCSLPKGRRCAEAALWRAAKAESRRHSRLGNLRYGRGFEPALGTRCEFLRAFAAVDEEEDGHANGQPVGDLFEDQGATAICNFAVDFDAAIDWARVHNEGIWFCSREARGVEAKEAGVFAEAGKHALALPFMLDAQQIDNVGI